MGCRGKGTPRHSYEGEYPEGSSRKNPGVFEDLLPLQVRRLNCSSRILCVKEISYLQHGVPSHFPYIATLTSPPSVWSNNFTNKRHKSSLKQPGSSRFFRYVQCSQFNNKQGFYKDITFRALRPSVIVLGQD